VSGSPPTGRTLLIAAALCLFGCSSDAGAPVSTVLDAATATDMAYVDVYSAQYDVLIAEFPRRYDSYFCATDTLALALRCNFTGGFHATIRSYDAAGNGQLQFDSVTTRSFEYDATIGLDGELTVPSKAYLGTDFSTAQYFGRTPGPGSNWTWTGTRLDTIAVTSYYSYPLYTVLRNTTLNNVVVGSGYPLSGSISRTGTVNVKFGPDNGMVHTFQSTLTFDGTQFPLLTLGGHSFRVDLVTAAVTVIN